MEISVVKGDLFESNAAIIFNAVNCEGVMGIGIAHEFKKRYPEMFELYRLACVSGIVSPGNSFNYLVEDENDVHQVIVNFPTKVLWRNNSRLEYIESGMQDFCKRLENGFYDKFVNGNYTIAIPALGCGYGGLNWTDVLDILVNDLLDVETEIDWNITIYEPGSN